MGEGLWHSLREEQAKCGDDQSMQEIVCGCSVDVFFVTYFYAGTYNSYSCPVCGVDKITELTGFCWKSFCRAKLVWRTPGLVVVSAPL